MGEIYRGEIFQGQVGGDVPDFGGFADSGPGMIAAPGFGNGGFATPNLGNGGFATPSLGRSATPALGGGFSTPTLGGSAASASGGFAGRGQGEFAGRGQGEFVGRGQGGFAGRGRGQLGAAASHRGGLAGMSRGKKKRPPPFYNLDKIRALIDNAPALTQEDRDAYEQGRRRLDAFLGNQMRLKADLLTLSGGDIFNTPAGTLPAHLRTSSSILPQGQQPVTHSDDVPGRRNSLAGKPYHQKHTGGAWSADFNGAFPSFKPARRQTMSTLNPNAQPFYTSAVVGNGSQGLASSPDLPPSMFPLAFHPGETKDPSNVAVTARPSLTPSPEKSVPQTPKPRKPRWKDAAMLASKIKSMQLSSDDGSQSSRPASHAASASTLEPIAEQDTPESVSEPFGPKAHAAKSSVSSMDSKNAVHDTTNGGTLELNGHAAKASISSSDSKHAVHDIANGEPQPSGPKAQAFADSKQSAANIVSQPSGAVAGPSKVPENALGIYVDDLASENFNRKGKGRSMTTNDATRPSFAAEGPSLSQVFEDRANVSEREALTFDCFVSTLISQRATPRSSRASSPFALLGPLNCQTCSGAWGSV